MLNDSPSSETVLFSITAMLFSIVAISSAYMRLSKTTISNDSKLEELNISRGVISIALLAEESSSIRLGMPPITTISFFTGTRLDLQKEFLVRRLVDIVKLNPWLGGRLVKVNHRLHLNYNQPCSNMSEESAAAAIETGPSPLLRFAKLPGISEDMKYEDLVSAVAPFAVSRTADVIGQDRALFTVTAVETSAETFAIIFSICHTIADGHTFYSLYGMLR